MLPLTPRLTLAIGLLLICLPLFFTIGLTTILGHGLELAGKRLQDVAGAAMDCLVVGLDRIAGTEW